MEVKRYKPVATVEFYTETGVLVARASNVEASKYDDDVISIQTVRDMGADAPTFSINLVNRKPWEEWVTPNDLIVIKMCRPPEANAEVLFGLVDDCRKKVVMNAEEPQRIVTVTGRGFAKALIEFDVGVVSEAGEYQDMTLGWLQYNGIVLAGQSTADILEVFWTNIIKKYVNYKWSNGKTMFDIATHKFTARPDITLMESASLISFEGSLWSFIKEISEAPFHESYWEIYQGKPILISRPTPFNEKDWTALPLLQITDEEVAYDSIGRSDLETYSLFSVGAKIMFSDADIYKTAGIPPLWYGPYAKKYGLRRLHVETRFALVSGSTNLVGSDAIRILREDLYNWNVLNNTMFNGTIGVRGSNRFKVGYRLKYNDREYYITSVSHSFTNFGMWVTELGVVRGIKPTARFKAPVGMGEDYPGIGLVTIDPIAVQQAAYDMALPISGNYLGIASDVVNAAYQWMNSGKYRYKFGANDLLRGLLDCSSFTYWIYKNYANIDLGRTTGQQVLKGSKVEKAALMPGDLVFFKNTYDSPHIYGVSHVGIYVGDGKFINNSSGSGTIVVDSIGSSYWVDHWLMGRRVLQSDTTGRTMTMKATAYGATVLNGGAGTGKTKMGTTPRQGYTVAVDPTVIPLGTKIRIESDYPGITGVYMAEDIGGAIKKNRIDIYFNDLTVDPQVARKAMFAFGTRDVKVTIIN